MYGLVFGATSDELWVLNAGQVFRIDWRNNRLLDRVSIGGSPGLQGIQFDPESSRVSVSNAEHETVRLLAIAKGRADVAAGGIRRQIAGSAALSRLSLIKPPAARGVSDLNELSPVLHS